MMNNQNEAGYDINLTMFSPEGRIYQVEYALEAVKRGALCIGIKCNSGAAIITRKKFTKLMDKDTISKLFLIDHHIGVAISGLHADSRILVDYSRIQSQIHRLNYSEDIRVPTITRKLSDIVQQYTQHGGVRPFGSSLLLCGIDPDGTPRVMTSSPSGTFWAWKSHAMGEYSAEAETILEDKYDKNMSIDDVINLGVEILKEVYEEEINEDTVQIGKISVEEKEFIILKTDEVKKYL